MGTLGTIRAITGENSVWDTRNQVFEMPEEFLSIFSFYTAALHLSASGVVIGVILKIMDSFFPMVRYIFGLRGEIVIFSSITERGVLLAEDIRKNRNKKSVFVFLKQVDKQDGQSELLTERIRDISGYIFAYDLEKLPLPLFSKRRTIDYFLLKENHDQNINDALCLANLYEEKASKSNIRKKVNVHILSDNPETECLLDTIHNDSNCTFKLINEMKLMLYQLIEENPLFVNAEDELEILVVGAGRNGLEAAKICSWCGYTSKLTPKVWLIDKDIAPKKKLMKECPEMLENNVVFRQIDVETPEFLEFLREHPKISYVICAVGDDHLNLRTALDIRAVSYEHGKCSLTEEKKPFIGVLLNDEFLHDKCESLSFRLEKLKVKRSYDLHAYGDLKKFYTWNNLCKSKIDCRGIIIHKIYDKKINEAGDFAQEYIKSNYDRDSSNASAMHMKNRIYSVLVEKGDIANRDRFQWKEEPTDEMIALYEEYMNSYTRESEELIDLAKLEHRRWNAYSRAQGWRIATAEDMQEWDVKEVFKVNKNIPARMHSNLVEWDELDEGTKGYDFDPFETLVKIWKLSKEIEEFLDKKY